MTQSNIETNITGTFDYELPLVTNRKWFKPLTMQCKVQFTDQNKDSLIELANYIQSTTPSIAAAPLWERQAKSLGLVLKINALGSLFDPLRLMLNAVLYFCRKALNRYGSKKYKEVFNIND